MFIMSWKGVKKQTNIEDIKAWCEEMGIENYTINFKCEIDVNGYVDLRGNNFKELPYKFGRVDGHFSLSHNKNLTSIKNCPNEVGGYFSCSFCPQLNSLEGCPKEVKQEFYCRECKREFTIEEIISLCDVKEYIYIGSNTYSKIDFNISNFNSNIILM